MQETNKNIEIWRLRKHIKTLKAARGDGASLISLIIPPRVQISRIPPILDEFQTALDHQSIGGQHYFLAAIASAQLTLTHYIKFPPSNGLVLYTGTVVTDHGRLKNVTVNFEPFKPINTALCVCDDKFHTEALFELLESDDKFGFIVMDGKEALFGTLTGNTREVLHRFTADLECQSATLQVEERHSYVRKTAELASQFFINPSTGNTNVSGLILAASDDFKTELSLSNMFGPRLQAKILTVVDVSYGGENGFSQAVDLSSEFLANAKSILEKRLLGMLREEMCRDTGKYVISYYDTLKALELGAVEILIVYENLDINRYVLKNSTTGEIVVKYLRYYQERNLVNFRDSDTNAELVIQEKMSLLEWLANEYKKFGCMLEVVADRSLECLFGIGAILRYQLDSESFIVPSDEEEVCE